MKKQTKSNWQTTFFAVVVTFIFISAASSLAIAQEAKVKVGDRVEVDVRGSIQAEPKWVKAKVIEVMMWQGKISGVYVITDDGVKMTVKETELRLLTGETPTDANTPTKNNQANAPTKNNRKPTNVNDGEWKPIVDENNTVLADRELIDCDFEQTTASPKARPPVELLKRLIRCANERPASKGSDGAVTMDITKFVVGTPRRWVAGSDFGNGNANTIVYPIEVSYKLTKFYRSGNTINENIWIYGCYVNNQRKWECGTNQRVKIGEAKNIP